MIEDKSLKDADFITESGKIFVKQFQNGLLRIIILWIISRNKIHGYGISKEINEFFMEFDKSDNKINPAKLYPILKKMEGRGLVVSEEGLSHNKKVKFYSITDKGIELLNFIKYNWSSLSNSDKWKLFLEDMMNVD